MDFNVKIIDYVYTVIKNSKEVKQLQNINFYVGFFLLTTLIFNATNLTIYYLHTSDTKMLIETIIQHNSLLDKKIYNINYKLNILLENQQTYLRLKQNEQNDNEQNDNEQNDNEQNDNEQNYNEQNDNKEDVTHKKVDNAECYDIVPVTNIKKTPLFHWIFT
jgi:hypothetical protein